jgi:hypothetical protein
MAGLASSGDQKKRVGKDRLVCHYEIDTGISSVMSSMRTYTSTYYYSGVAQSVTQITAARDDKWGHFFGRSA